MTVDLEQSTLLTKEETAARLKAKPRTVWAWGAEGRLEVIHLTARSLRYTAASVDRMMAAEGSEARAS